MATLKKILEAARLIERTDTAPEAPPSNAGRDDDLDALIRRAAAAESPAPTPDQALDGQS
jgi:hypothetical protein